MVYFCLRMSCRLVRLFLCKLTNAVLFSESSTSLEVHLSYHKENLLTRWATNQDALDKSSNSSSGSGSHYVSPLDLLESL